MALADRMAYVLVAAGQVTCIITDAQRPLELLWHAFATESAQMYLASAKLR